MRDDVERAATKAKVQHEHENARDDAESVLEGVVRLAAIVVQRAGENGVGQAKISLSRFPSIRPSTIEARSISPPEIVCKGQ
ncbi:MAG: hypothetical protein WAN43_10750 [Rhodomicrobium sp.]